MSGSWILTGLATLFSLYVNAQTLTVSPAQIAFGTVYENAPDSLLLTISNTLGHDVDVTGFRFYDIYGQPAFSAGRTAFTVADQSSETVWIRFSPRHNIYHNSELIIENNSHRGAVTADLTGQGRYSNAYYDSTENKTEEDLKNALQAVTGNGYVSLGYVVARDSMFMVIDNKFVNGQGASQNTLECVYTGRQAIGYTSRTDCQTNYSFNTEHTFPQGFFSSLEPMRSDLHHLFPTDDTANNVRSNYPYGVVASPTWQSGGSKYASNIFEPRNAQKGVAARAMFYFVIRYQNYSGFLNSQETVLRSWHAAYPPGAIEKTRNDDIDAMQHNRNPFVDYPQFADRIASFSNTSVQSPVFSLDLSEPSADYGYISSSVTHVYSICLVNNGNQPVSLTGFILSPPSLFSFANGTGGNALVPPGEAVTGDIAVLTPPERAINGGGDLSTIIHGSPTVSIPLHADGASPVGIGTVHRLAPVIYPNPVSDWLVVEHMLPGQDILVTDITGRPVMNVVATGEKIRLDCSGLASGIYLLHAGEGLVIPILRK